eukprot:4159708-Alexandrium_andersonii.AAC.1
MNHIQRLFPGAEARALADDLPVGRICQEGEEPFHAHELQDIVETAICFLRTMGASLSPTKCLVMSSEASVRAAMK